MPTTVLDSQSTGSFTVELVLVEETTAQIHARDFRGNSLSGSPAEMACLALEILHAAHDEITIR